MSAEVVAAMAQAARLAPSIHNSQPWRFETTTDRLEIYADHTRSTPAVDPLGRWVYVACGSAAFNAAAAARALGRRGTVTLLPDRSRPDLMAVITLDGVVQSSGDDLALAQAIPERHTVRTPFEGSEVPPAIVDRLRAAAEREGTWLQVIHDPADIIELIVLTERAEAAEASDERYRDELRAWMRGADDPSDDGIRLDAIPAAGSYGRGSPVPLRDFRGDGPVVTSAGEPPAVEHPLLVVIGTDGDHHLDWLRAGLGMQRLWLTATAAGLSASPVSQALDHAGPRLLLARLVGLDKGHAQMLLRLGYGDHPAITGRRPLAAMLGH
ncbi:MAG: hypothetical protein QOI76_3506 [Frankiales bacterium]|nr:hypothetical protein [Frankiales bacterium]